VKRYFIQLAYHGEKYHGWQIQPNALTVQEVINRTLTLLLQSPIETMGQGRTDTGVHARDFYAHFDYDGELPANFLKAVQGNLPRDISVYRIFPVHVDAHARFTAISRTYEFHLHTYRNPFLNGQSWYFPFELDAAQMQQAIMLLLGEQDFSCFSKQGVVVNNYICNISQAKVEFFEKRVIFTFTANRFLRNMVRAMVGTLLDVGRGKINVDELNGILQSKNRSKAGSSANPEGLFLTKIEYPEWVAPEFQRSI
jgi:tRNA pseudouridine38-40 synthase